MLNNSTSLKKKEKTKRKMGKNCNEMCLFKVQKFQYNETNLQILLKQLSQILSKQFHKYGSV